MSRISLDSIREFIKMYHMEGTVGVASVDGKLLVVNDFGTDNETTYVCQTLTAAACCVNDIIFDIPIGRSLPTNNPKILR